MSFGYRVIKYQDNDGYGLHGVYFDENGQVTAWTERASVVGDTPEEISEQLLLMRISTKRFPALDEGVLRSRSGEVK